MGSIAKYFKKMSGKSKKKADIFLPEGIKMSQYVHPLVDSHSQYNEDLIIDALLKCKEVGTYVDIGANDPSLLNNTMRFYKRGWSGINVEPDPRLYNKLIEQRPRDINLNIGIGPVPGKMKFYIMSADTLSSFNKDAALESGRIHGATLVSSQQVTVRPLMDIFDEYLVKREIDFMSVDTEGFDLAVLRSNDWLRYRPLLLMVEINQGGLEIIAFLEQFNYMLIYCNDVNGILIDMRRNVQDILA